MGEKVILVCDICGQPAADTANIKVGRRSLVKDLCGRHIAELVAGARRARPGRRRAVSPTPNGSAAPKRRGRPPKSAAKSAAKDTTPSETAG